MFMMTCFTYVQFFIKWFRWMILFCSENVIFFMLKQFNNVLIQTSMAYGANIIRSLFYLLREIHNLVISLFLFLTPLFWYSFCISGFSWHLLLIYSKSNKGFSWYLLFWHSLCFPVFSLYLAFWCFALYYWFLWYLAFSYFILFSGFL